LRPPRAKAKRRATVTSSKLNHHHDQGRGQDKNDFLIENDEINKYYIPPFFLLFLLLAYICEDCMHSTIETIFNFILTFLFLFFVTTCTVTTRVPPLRRMCWQVAALLVFSSETCLLSKLVILQSAIPFFVVTDRCEIYI